MLGHLVGGVVNSFSTEFDLKELKSFIAGKKLGVNERKINEAIEGIEIAIQWRKFNENDLKIWLEKRV